MADDHARSDRKWQARWGRGDVVRTSEGGYRLPITVENRPLHLELSPDEAAVIQAQLTRLLTEGWAMTEGERAARERSENYQVYDDGYQGASS